MIAIHTKYISQTDNLGARIKAYTAASGSIKGFTATIAYPYELSAGHDVHFEAVKALVSKHNLDWDLKDMRYGGSADGKGFSFCFNDSKL